MNAFKYLSAALLVGALVFGFSTAIAHAATPPQGDQVEDCSGCGGGFFGGFLHITTTHFSYQDGGGGGGESPIPYCTLTTVTPTIYPGGAATLLWASANITSLSVNNGVGGVTPVGGGSVVVHPSGTTTYIATGMGSYGSVTCQTTVTVTTPPPTASCTLTATPSTISSGNSSALSWSSTGVSTLTIDHGVGSVSPVSGGTVTVTPSVTTTYTATGSVNQCSQSGSVVQDADGMYNVAGATQPITITVENKVVDNRCTEDIYGWYFEDASGNPMTGKVIWVNAYISHGDTYTKTFSVAELAGVARIGFFAIPSAGGNIDHSMVSAGSNITFVQQVGGPHAMQHFTEGASSLYWAAYIGATEVPPRPVFTNPSLNNNIYNLNGPGLQNMDYVGDSSAVGNQNWFGTSCSVSTCGNLNFQVDATRPGTCQTVQCSATVTVTPPQNGCIQILKETYNPAGNPVTPVAQFTFKLDGNAQTTVNDANGNAIFMNVTPGAHDVSEIIPNNTWTQLSVTPTNGHVIVPAGSICAAVVFKNKQVVTEQPHPTITVKKIIDADGNLSTTNDQTLGVGWTFGVDTTVATTSSNGQTSAITVDAGTHSVTEAYKAGYSLVGASCTGAINNGSLTSSSILGIQVGAASNVVCTFYNKPLPPPPGNGCIKVLKETFNTNGDALTPVAQFTFTLDGNQTVTNDAAGNAIFNNVSVGTHTVTESIPNANWTQLSVTPNNGTVIVSEGTNCAGVVFKNKQVVNNNPSPACTLSISATQINPGQSVIVNWTSTNETQGFITGGVGTTSPVSSGSMEIFPSDDTTFFGTFTGPYGTTTCQAAVTVIKGGGGCQGNCGGGLNPPNVVLLKKPGEAPLAFISLSQIPYTGFEAGPALTLIFWTAVGILAALIAYFVMGKGGVNFLLGNALQFAGAGQYYRRDEDEDRELPEYTYATAPVMAAPVYAAPVAVAPLPAPVKVATDGIPDLAEVIESRAHGAAVLMSPEAIHMALALSTDRSETLRMFGEILNQAVKTIPREDGWILLNSERFEELAKSTPKVATLATVMNTPSVESILASVMTPPPAPKVKVEMSMSSGDDQAVVMNLVRSLLKGDREAAYATARALEMNGASGTTVMTIIATALDQLYRARRHGTSTDLTNDAAFIPDDKLGKIVETFAHGMDHGYSNAYTGLKLAIAQAFEIRA